MPRASLVVLAAGLLCPAASDAQDAAESECRQRMEVLGAAYGRFLVMMDGKPPERLSDFYTQGIVLDLDTFTCPAASNRITEAKQIDQLTVYEVTAKLADKTPMLLLKEKRGFHGGQSLAYYSDRTFRKIASTPTATNQTSQPTATNTPVVMVTNADGTATLTLTTASNQVAFYDALGREHYRNGRWADGEAAFRQAARLEPTNMWHPYNLGMCLGQQTRWREAEASFLETIRLAPSHAATRGLLGDARYHQSKWGEAEAEYREAIRLDPTNARYQASLGAALRNQARWAAAESAYREAARLEPKSAQHHLELGNACVYQGKLAEAEAPYREAIRLDPSNAWAHGGLGHVFHSKRQFAEAEASYREAIRLNPRFGQLHTDLAGTLLWLGRTGEAQAAAQQAIRLGHAQHWVYREPGLSAPAGTR